MILSSYTIAIQTVEVKMAMNQPKRILIVDDEAQNRNLLQTILKDFGYEVEIARDGIEALAKLKLDIDLVLLDVMMPGMDGFEVVRRIRQDDETFDVPVMMVTGMARKEDRLRAVEAGANDFIEKPVDLAEMKVRTASLLKMKEAQDALKRHQAELEGMIAKRTAALREALDDMTEAQRKAYEAQVDTIQRLALAAEYKDEDTASHIRRIGDYCAILGRGLSLTPGEVEMLALSSPMHDVGKIGTPDSILFKQAKLTNKEFEIIKQHTIIGGRILAGSSSELLQAGETIALSHHEKWDGSGYPEGLAKEKIPLFGRICAVSDVFDALTSARPYKEAFSNERAFTILRKESGDHFDPKIVEVFFATQKEILEVQDKYCDEKVQRK